MNVEPTQETGILLVSHGACCEGLLDTLTMVAGEQDGVCALPLAEGMDPDVYREQIERWLEPYGENALILIDVLGGTPFNQVMRIGKNRPVHAVTGMSVPMALEAVVMRASMTPAELVEHLCATAATSVQSVESLLAALGSSDDDDEDEED